MKKTTPIFLICVTLLLLVVLAYLSPYFYFMYIGVTKYQVENFGAFEEDFELMVDFTKDYFESQENDNSKIIGVGYDIKSKNHTLWYNGNNIKISEKLQTSLNRVTNEAFNANLDSRFDRIVYYNDKISLEIDNGSYALVYSFDGKKPSFNIQNKNAKTHIKKIKDHWYHVFYIVFM